MSIKAASRMAFSSGAAFLLAACWVSETPMLDAKSGRAQPLPFGAWQMCNIDEGGEPDCADAVATDAGDGAYVIAVDDDAPTAMRFRKIARDGWLAQAGEGDGYFYFAASKKDGVVTLVMMACEDTPAAMKADLERRGLLKVDKSEFAAACVPLKRQGAEIAARAYLKGDIPVRSKTLITPAE